MDCQCAAGGLHRGTRSRPVEKFPSFTLAPQIAVACFFLLSRLAPVTMAAPKVVASPAPPQPMEQKVTVKRGGSVEIPLKIYGTRAQTLGWIIKQPPQHGKLSAVKATGAESAVVTYRPPADVRLGADRFTFSVRSSEGVSAPVEVTIGITDEPPQISTAGDLNFGTLLAGTKAIRTLEISNRGGGFAEGMIEVDPPWKLEGARAYKLAAGERRELKITFAPERAGKFSGEVKFTSQADAAVTLSGVAEDGLAVVPGELVLEQDAGRSLRAAAFEIRNHTDAALEVAVAASPRLLVKRSVQVAAQAAVVLTVQTAEADVEVLDETVVLSAGGFMVRLPVRARALTALVRARPESVVFQNGAKTDERVILANHGGMPAKVTLGIGAPFSVEERGFVLASGAEKEVVISLAAVAGGGAQGVLQVGFDGGGFEIPVEAAGSALPVIAPALRRLRPTAPGRARTEDEVAAPVAPGSGVYAAKVDSVSASSATFRWQGALAEGAEFRCFQQVLTTDEEGELVSAFREYTAWKLARAGEANSATVENLEPGKAYLFRIDEVSATRANPVAFAQIRTPMPPVRESFFSLVGVLTGLAIVAACVSIWQRKRARSGF